MSKDLFAELQFPLPEGEFEEAAHKCKIKPIWDDFLKALDAAGIKHTPKLGDDAALRHKRGPKAANGTTRRTRTARVVAPPANGEAVRAAAE